MSTPRYELRFFFDVGVETCLWAANEAARERFGYPVNLTALPLRPTTVDQVRKLTHRYAESIDWKDPNTELSPWSEEEYDAFNQRAREALRSLRIELGAEYGVRDEHTDSRNAF